MASDLIPSDKMASRQLTEDPATSFHEVTVLNLLLNLLVGWFIVYRQDFPVCGEGTSFLPC